MRAGEGIFVSKVILSIFQVPLSHEGLSRQTVWERSSENSPGFCVMEEELKMRTEESLNLLLVGVLWETSSNDEDAPVCIWSSDVLALVLSGVHRLCSSSPVITLTDRCPNPLSCSGWKLRNHP